MEVTIETPRKKGLEAIAIAGDDLHLWVGWDSLFV